MGPWTCNFQNNLKEVLNFPLGPLKCKFLSSLFQFAAISEVDLCFLIRVNSGHNKHQMYISKRIADEIIVNELFVPSINSPKR